MTTQILEQQLELAVRADKLISKLVKQNELNQGLKLFTQLQTLFDGINHSLLSLGIFGATFSLSAYEQDFRENSQSRMLTDWISALKELLLARSALNKPDKLFMSVMTFIENNTEEKLIEGMRAGYEKWKQSVSDETATHFVLFNWNIHFWGKFNPEHGEYEMFIQRANILKHHLFDFEWLYRSLCDYRSKAVLAGLLYYWLTLDPVQVLETKESLYHDYFDLDLIPCTANEVFVDLGAYVGDTAAKYLESYGEQNYKRIYCYEILDENLTALRQNLKGCRDIVIRPCGAGAQNGEMFLEKGKYAAKFDGGSRLSDAGTVKIPVVALDNDIQEPITFLKMDIEGAEYEAINGARCQIKKNKPKMAISVYHSNDDLWRIARLIDSISPDYKYYMRFNGTMNHIIADYTLICIP
jgi:FkbM family methyltransferase